MLFFSFQIAQSALLRMSADFTHLFGLFRSVYEDLVSKGVIQPAGEVPPPTVPMDYSWARVSMLERVMRIESFYYTISDKRWL